MRVNIYMESSIKGIRRKNGIVGYVIEATGMEGKTVTQFGTVSNVTNVQSYLLGLKFALKRIRDKSDLCIWMDNAFLDNAWKQDWISRWQQNDWKNSKGEEVAYRQQWEEVLDLLEGHVPEFQIAKTHSFKEWMEREIERRMKDA